MKSKHLHIKENSFLARLGAKKLGSDAVALVWGKTIHLHNISREEFLQDTRLVKHELCHIRQYRQHGHIFFLIKYIWETIRKGYYNNKFEVEAREAEKSL